MRSVIVLANQTDEITLAQNFSASWREKLMTSSSSGDSFLKCMRACVRVGADGLSNRAQQGAQYRKLTASKRNVYDAVRNSSRRVV